jgi:hypothetical protein
MDRETARSAAQGLAGLRILIGVLAFFLPRLALRGWVGGKVASESGGRLLSRSVGARDIALGAGALLAERHDAPVRGWIEAGALSDLGDLAATLAGFKELPRFTRFGVLFMTGGAIAAGALIAPSVDQGA